VTTPLSRCLRKEYDFSKAKRKPYAKRPKRQVTIRLDHGTITGSLRSRRSQRRHSAELLMIFIAFRGLEAQTQPVAEIVQYGELIRDDEATMRLLLARQ